MTWAAHTHNACQPGMPPAPAVDRCSGHCCRSFKLSWDHSQLARWWRGEPVPSALGSHPDLALILSMIIPLPDSGPDQYSCRFFDGESCRAYDARPAMCSAYPYGKRCEHGKLCTSNVARRGGTDYPDRARLRLRVLK